MPSNLIPNLGYLKSDFSDRPNAGTSADPIIVGTDLYPNSTWYPAVHGLTTGQSLSWSAANYYNTAGGNLNFWTLIVNNEPSLDNNTINTGAPDRSQPVNGTNFKLSHDSAQATMRVTQTWGDGSDYQSNPSGSGNIPYFGINTLGSQYFTGNYGGGLIVQYDLGANFVTNSYGFQTYEFMVYTTNSVGVRKAACFYLAPPNSEAFLGFTAPWDLDWDWRFQGSVYYPGRHFRFFFPSYYNAHRGTGVTAIPTIDTNGTTYTLKFDLDDIIKVIYPEDAVSSTAITGIELSIEQTWGSVAPRGTTLYTEAVISNVQSYSKYATCTITPRTTSANEGTVVHWDIVTTGIPDGTVLYWANEGTTDGYDFSDLVVGPSTGNDGQITITNNAATFYKTIANDLTTEGLETIVMKLRTGAGVLLATSPTVTVNDTSTTPTTSSDATLSVLLISNGTLSPAFNPNIISYTDSVDNGVTLVTITPVRNESHATITVNGTPVTSGSASGAISLSVGSNTITIVVTAQDNSTKTYTITVTRAPAVASNDATLSALSISSGTLSPSFSSGTTSYTASVLNGVSSIIVTPAHNEVHSIINVNGSPVTSGSASGPISLSVGSNTITVIVTAQNGSTTKTYTVTVTRLLPPLSNDATLSALTISSGILNPTFRSGATAYTDSVLYETTSIVVTPTSNESHAGILVNGTPVTSGSASGSISLNVGSNTISIVVVAQDNTVITYTILVNRSSSTVSTDATLSALTVSSGTLSPSFSSGTTSYTDSVIYFVNSIIVTPTCTSLYSTITVNGTPVNSGSSADSVGLTVGTNIITVVVTAQDGITTKTYLLTVIRKPADPSRDATLSALTISTNSLFPSFKSGVTEYSAFSVFSNSVTVTPTSNNPNATITVNDISVTSGYRSNAINIYSGSITVTIVVTAADGVAKLTYRITLNRAYAEHTIDLGTVRASNNQVISVKETNLAPTEEGIITYAFADGQLPEGLLLDTTSGYLHGFIGYQPAYLLTYKIAIIASKTIKSSGSIVSTVNEYRLHVKGEVESNIEWVSNSDLGSIETGIISELAVVAKQLNSNYSIKYSLTSGNLPEGLTLGYDGSIIGKVTHNITGTFTFSVLASDVYQLSSISQTFTVRSVQTDTKKYTEMYFKPFFSKQKREDYKTFISNEFTFDPKLLYRYFDPNFGVQSEIKMFLEFGIEQINLNLYRSALSRNFYRKQLYFGDIKKAIAIDSTGSVIYEVVYIEPIDTMVNNNGVSVSSRVTINNVDYYPNSIENMRGQLESMRIINSTISVNEYNKPKFMRTPQSGDYGPPKYISVIPLCYALPGQGDKIISRIKLSGFDFKLLNFEVDRLIVQESADNASAKYLILEG